LNRPKKILRTGYSTQLKGKSKSPPFITTLQGVTGRTRDEKVANMRRVLSTCKKVGIPLVKQNGTGFKSYRTLVTQCGVKFRTPTSTSILNQKPGKLARNKGLARVKEKIISRRKPKTLSIPGTPGVPGTLSISNASVKKVEYFDKMVGYLEQIAKEIEARKKLNKDSNATKNQEDVLKEAFKAAEDARNRYNELKNAVTPKEILDGQERAKKAEQEAMNKAKKVDDVATQTSKIIADETEQATKKIMRIDSED
jgi:hypothetical protein